MNYNRLELLAHEAAEFRMLRNSAPFRTWFAVKAENHEARYFDNKRAANAFAKQHAPAAIYTL